MATPRLSYPSHQISMQYVPVLSYITSRGELGHEADKCGQKSK